MFICPQPAKKFYDTEFAAQRAQAITEHARGKEMEYYKCGLHWHLTTIGGRVTPLAPQTYRCRCGEEIRVGHVQEHLEICRSQPR